MSYRILIQMQADVARLQRDVEESKRILTGMSSTAVTAFRRVGAAFAATFTAGAIVGVVRSLTGVVNAIDDLSEAAQGVGTTTIALAEMSQAARQAGLNSEQLQQAMAKLASRMSEATAGNRDAIFAFQQLGVQIQDARGNLLTTDQVMAQIAERFRTYRDGAEKSAAASALFGERVGRRLVPFLNQGAEGLRVNAGLTKEMVEEAERAQRALDDLAAAWQRIKFAIAGATASLINWIAAIKERREEAARQALEESLARRQSEFAAIQGLGQLAEEARLIEEIIELEKALGEIRRKEAEESLARFMAGAQAARRAEAQVAAPRLVRNVAGEQFIESLRKSVQSLEMTDMQLLRLEAAQKGVSRQAEEWLQRLERIRETSREIELIIERVSAEQAAMATADRAVSGAASIFATVADEARLARMTEAGRKQAEIMRAFAELRAEVAASGLTGDDLQRAIDAIDEWNDATLTALREQQRELQSWEFGWDQAMQRFVESVRDGAKIAQEAFETMTTSMENAFVELFTRGTLNMRRFLEEIAAMILRAQFRRMLLQLLPPDGGIVRSIVGALAGARAAGGPVSSGQAYLVGERGPELFVPRSSGTIVPSAASISVQQTIYIDSRSDRQSIIEAMERTRRRTIADIQDAVRRGAAHG